MPRVHLALALCTLAMYCSQRRAHPAMLVAAREHAFSPPQKTAPAHEQPLVWRLTTNGLSAFCLHTHTSQSAHNPTSRGARRTPRCRVCGLDWSLRLHGGRCAWQCLFVTKYIVVVHLSQALPLAQHSDCPSSETVRVTLLPSKTQILVVYKYTCVAPDLRVEHAMSYLQPRSPQR